MRTQYISCRIFQSIARRCECEKREERKRSGSHLARPQTPTYPPDAYDVSCSPPRYCSCNSEHVSEHIYFILFWEESERVPGYRMRPPQRVYEIVTKYFVNNAIPQSQIVWKLAEDERARFEYLVSSKQQYGPMSSNAYEPSRVPRILQTVVRTNEK